VDGEVHRQLASRLAQDAPQTGIETEPVSREIELLLRDVPGIDGSGNLLRGHGFGSPPLFRFTEIVANLYD
jgi:hypothetical protein